MITGDLTGHGEDSIHLGENFESYIKTINKEIPKLGQALLSRKKINNEI